jgi:Pyruvate/2-oxoacid:ferredoxin oxidoreductase gamma subunit
MTQNFGPEARGGDCSAQLVLSDSPVLYPYVTRPDILVVMSQEAYTRFITSSTTAEHRAAWLRFKQPISRQPYSIYTEAA